MFAFLTLATFFVALSVALIAPAVAHAIKLAEFRQQWINDQRKDVAEYLGLSRRWYEMWDDFTLESDQERKVIRFEKQFDLANKTLVVLWRIKMRMNPLDSNPDKAADAAFLRALDVLIDPGSITPHPVNPPEMRWRPFATEAVDQATLLFKREWEKTKIMPPRRLWSIFARS